MSSAKMVHDSFEIYIILLQFSTTMSSIECKKKSKFYFSMISLCWTYTVLWQNQPLQDGASYFMNHEHLNCCSLFKVYARRVWNVLPRTLLSMNHSNIYRIHMFILINRIIQKDRRKCNCYMYTWITHFLQLHFESNCYQLKDNNQALLQILHQ
jgi:hypothetical protein